MVKVGSHASLPVGYTVCKVGFVTAQTCGEVTASGTPRGGYVQSGADFVKASYCSDPGDSGAGVHHKYPMLKPPPGVKLDGRYEAVGIHSGGPSKTVVENGVEQKVR